MSSSVVKSHIKPYLTLQVYYISKATLKVANKQYNTLSHDYEVTLHAHSTIVPCADAQDIPAVQCDFVPIAELENRDKDSVIGKQNKMYSFERSIWLLQSPIGLQLMVAFILKHKQTNWTFKKIYILLFLFLFLDQTPPCRLARIFSHEVTEDLDLGGQGGNMT